MYLHFTVKASAVILKVLFISPQGGSGNYTEAELRAMGAARLGLPLPAHGLPLPGYHPSLPGIYPPSATVGCRA